MGEEINISIKDSCPYIPRKKREECWEGESCNKIYFDDLFGGVTCPKVIREICEYGGGLEFGDELSIMENAYGRLSYSEIQEIFQTRKDMLSDRLGDIIKAFSKKNV